MKKVVKLTESDLIEMVKNIVNEQGMFNEPSKMEIMARKVIPNINIVNNPITFVLFSSLNIFLIFINLGSFIYY